MIMRLLRHTVSSITKVRRFRWVIEMDRLVHSGVGYTMYIYRKGAFLWRPVWFISG